MKSVINHTNNTQNYVPTNYYDSLLVLWLSCDCTSISKCRTSPHNHFSQPLFSSLWASLLCCVQQSERPRTFADWTIENDVRRLFSRRTFAGARFAERCTVFLRDCIRVSWDTGRWRRRCVLPNWCMFKDLCGQVNFEKFKDLCGQVIVCKA